MTDEEVRATVEEELAIVLAGEDATIEVEPIDGGGWRVLLRRPVGAKPILGFGAVFVHPDGRVVRYPSSYSPRMALEQFRLDREQQS